MHLLLIIVILVIAFPALARYFGSIVRLIFWLVVVGMFIAVAEAIF
jgi:hypothetical protein